MKTKILVPVLSSKTIEIALATIDYEESSVINCCNWDSSEPEELAALHVARQELNEYAKQMTENFGALYGAVSDRPCNVPIETERFSAAVKDMLQAIYGEYLPIIEEDRRKTSGEQAG